MSSLLPLSLAPFFPFPIWLYTSFSNVFLSLELYFFIVSLIPSLNTFGYHLYFLRLLSLICISLSASFQTPLYLFRHEPNPASCTTLPMQEDHPRRTGIQQWQQCPPPQHQHHIVIIPPNAHPDPQPAGCGSQDFLRQCLLLHPLCHGFLLLPGYRPLQELRQQFTEEGPL